MKIFNTHLTEDDRHRVAAKEKRNKCSRDYYHANKEECRAKAKIWLSNNKEKTKEWQREYYKKNRDRITALRLDKYKKNRDSVLTRIHNWKIKKKRNGKTLMGFIYAIRGLAGVKIGRAKSIKNRLEDLRLGDPTIFLLASAEVSDVYAESLLHRKFNERRIIGEWFNITDEQATAGIAEMKARFQIQDGTKSA